MIAVTIPVALVQQANEELEALGFGPANFSVALESGGAVTHFGLSCWELEDFRAALESMLPRYPGMVAGESLDSIMEQQALAVSDQPIGPGSP